MKTRNSKLLLFGIVLLLAACSKNSENDDIEPENLIVGEWIFISENDYFCGTYDVAMKHGSDQSVQTMVFEEDGTCMYYIEGETFSGESFTGEEMNTWENLGNGIYTFNSETDTATVKIEFDGNNVMRFQIGECFESAGGENLYGYTVWNRQ